VYLEYFVFCDVIWYPKSTSKIREKRRRILRNSWETVLFWWNREKNIQNV